jgi:hypothetical protein
MGKDLVLFSSDFYTEFAQQSVTAWHGIIGLLMNRA